MNERIEKIKQHFSENRNAYIAGSVCLIVGVAGGVFINRQLSVKQIVDMANIKYKSPTTNNVIQLVIPPSRRMHPGFLTICKETNEITASVRSMAKLKGVNLGHLQQHLNGVRDNVNGLHFETIGEAANTISDLAG